MLWPKEGKRHNQDYFFHRDEIDAALRATAARAAIVESDDGVVKIAPAFPLARKFKPATKRSAPTGSPSQVIQQRSVGNSSKTFAGKYFFSLLRLNKCEVAGMRFQIFSVTYH